MEIISADQRLETDPFIKGVIVGPEGIGKTSLLYSLEGTKNLFVNIEAGALSAKDWAGGKILKPTGWQDCKDIAAALAGVDEASAPAEDYGPNHVAQVMAGPLRGIVGADVCFIDSITAASRLCFRWACQQPECFNKQGVLDKRGAYGLLKIEMVAWLNRLQRVPNAHIWCVGGIDTVRDDAGYVTHSVQVEGAGTGRELPYIFDQIITMAEVESGDGPRRAFITKRPNPWGYPAKDRSGALDVVEPANLGHIINKILAADNAPSERVVFHTQISKPNKEAE